MCIRDRYVSRRPAAAYWVVSRAYLLPRTDRSGVFLDRWICAGACDSGGAEACASCLEKAADGAADRLSDVCSMAGSVSCTGVACGVHGQCAAPVSYTHRDVYKRQSSMRVTEGGRVMRAHSYPEARWQQLRHRHGHRFSIAEEPNGCVRPCKLRDHLTTSTAGRELMP